MLTHWFLSEETQGEESHAKNKSTVHLLPYIKCCISGEKIQNLSNLREKTNQAHTVVKEPYGQLQAKQEAESFTHLLHISVW